MYLGIDIGGTKTLIATLSDTGELLDERRFPTNPDYDGFLKDLADNLQALPHEGTTRACAAVPGLLDRRAGTVHALGNLPWRDKPIRDDISKVLGVPLIIENDSKLAGLYEALLVKDKSDDVLFLTVSTGLGGALIWQGKLLPALQNMEMGKMPLRHHDQLEYWEDFAGGRSLMPRFHKQAAEITDPDDWRLIGEHLGYGLASVCSILQPEIIILGGSVGAYADNYKDIILDYLKVHLHPVVRPPKDILPAQRPDDAVIYGCYELIKQTEAGNESADR